MLDFHKRYGNIVRIAPDELAFSHPDAWKDIMGHKNGQEAEMGKAMWFYRPIEEPPHIVNETPEQHKNLRRQMAHGFSEKGMRDQESSIRKYVDLLLEKLHEKSSKPGGDPVILSDWYNFTTFDIIGDLAFGEPFGCLSGSNYDGWIKSIFDMAYIGSILQALSFYPLLKRALLSLVPKSAQDAYEKHKVLTKAKMLRRMAIKEERPDLIEGLLKKRDELVRAQRTLVDLFI
jgi:cytochrome P450